MYPIHRTPEQGHSARCLAKALIAAVENLRDSCLDNARQYDYATGEWVNKPEWADHEFRLSVQDNLPLAWADGYLADGTTECICPLPLDEARKALA